MPDREKVINAVETAFELWIDEYTGCSWFKEDEVRQAKEDALALLKKQEPMEPITDKWRNYICPVCGDRLRGGKFCMNCGQAVKWSEVD